MRRLIVGRLLAAVPTLLLVSVLTFALIHLFPGSPADAVLGTAATPEERAAVEAELGLDMPPISQYMSWLGDVMRGDLGASLISGEPVTDALLSRLPATLSLAAAGLLTACLLGFPVGLLAAMRPGGRFDHLVTLVSSVGLAVPSFWVAMVLARWLGAEYGWFPAIGYTPLSENLGSWLHGLVLPAVVLGSGPAAVIARQGRGALIDVLGRDYIRTCKSNGLTYGRIVRVHALRNALPPVLTVLGFQAALVLGTSFVVELVFAISGVGELGVRSVLDQDLPMVQGFVMLTAFMVVMVNIVVDVMYGVLDPRVRPT